MRKLMILLLVAIVCMPLAAGELDEQLIEAAQQERLDDARQLLEKGAAVDAANRYGATPLFFAVDKGHLEMVKLLLEKGASVDITDSFYNATPLGWGSFKMGDNPEMREILLLVLAKGPADAAAILPAALQAGDLELVKAAVATGKLDAAALTGARVQAEAAGHEEIVSFLADKIPAADAETETAELAEPPELDAAALERYVGQFKNEEMDLGIKIFTEGDTLKGQADGQEAIHFDPKAPDVFTAREAPITVTFGGRGGLVESFMLEQGGREFPFSRFDPASDQPAEQPELPAIAKAERGEASPWPSFRGRNASGVGDGQGAVTTWNGESGENVLWKTAIPGISLSSPVIWGDRVYVTAAASEGDNDTFRTGLYGDVDSVDDDSVHSFRVYALDLHSGEIRWMKEASRGVPQVKRHLKSSHANPTPVTDGERVVAHFGSEGLFCYSKDGELLWSKDLGRLDSGWFFDPSYQWGFASSPILHDGKVIVQTDIHKGSYVAAFDVATGEELWRTGRDEIPTWGTPGILPPKDPGGVYEVVTNGTTVRGYSAATGEELWMLAPNSEVTVGTPIVADGLAIVTGGYPPVRPIYAIAPGGRGDLSPAEGETSSEYLVWSVKPGGTYMPTPIAYGGLLYMLNNNGRLAAYDTKTGERVYRQRVGRGATGFSGSPVAADGRLFLTTEDGDTHVVRAGRDYEHLGVNELGEVVMTTPAISDGVFVIRGMKHVYGLGTVEAPAEDGVAEEAAAGEKTAAGE
ncbi:MAG: PQQ-binding-like beta-propeller repeat protein [Acidobacteriota bacterium]